MNRSLAWACLGFALAVVVLGGACQMVNEPPDAGTSEATGGDATATSVQASPSSGDPSVSEAGASDTETATTAAIAGDSAERQPLPLTDEELAEGWIALFDGRTLFGWSAGSEANWQVEDGTITVSSGKLGLLYTTTQFADYVLRLDFRSDPGTNSGIFLHTPPTPEDPAKDCYELNIAGADNPFPTGSLVGRLKAEGNFESDQWQSYEVTIEGGSVTVRLDGRQILQYTDPQPLGRGHIGLQLNEGRVAFRNIRLKPLGLKPLFNGKDLSGWKTYPEMPSKFTVTEQGWLNVKDGRGQLETEQSFGDFVLQLWCMTHARELNSGVFFRCIPGDVMMGYECQIHNGFKDGDRSRPMDCGTGGIFRRQDARFVATDDLEWFPMTLIADGPHMAAWAGGLQVSDWTDDRTADDNPRKGLRLAPGTIMIQGHDPTTDLSFRDIYAGELASRSRP